MGLMPRLDRWIAGDTFLGLAGVGSEKCFLVRAGADAFLVSATAFLVDKDYPVLRSLINRFTGAGGRASWVGAVVANSLQIKHPGW